MSGRTSLGDRRTAIRVGLALVAVGCCLGAAAYAAVRPGPPPGGRGERAEGRQGVPAGTAEARPPRPRIVRHPARIATVATAAFAFESGGTAARLRCSIDGGRWAPCAARVSFAGLFPGSHELAVRAFNRRGRGGPAAGFGWKQVEPKPFAIEPRLSDLAALYPGAAPLTLPVRLTNPNPVPISITAVRVSVTASPPGCDGAANLELIPAGLSAKAPLKLAPGGSASLPGAAAPPAIALRDLPVNQDPCKGGSFALAFSGGARG